MSCSVARHPSNEWAKIGRDARDPHHSSRPLNSEESNAQYTTACARTVGHKSSHDGLSILKRYPSSLSGVPAQACSHADPFSEIVWRSVTTHDAKAQLDFPDDAAQTPQPAQTLAHSHRTRAADALAPAVSKLHHRPPAPSLA
jgi:hypothetical protein